MTPPDLAAVVESGSAVLALDTSTRTGAVAVLRDARVLASRTLDEGLRHAAGLIPAIERALVESGVERRAVGGVIVGAGPGSFTGVRIAAATAKGLVAGLRVPLFAVSSLAAAAASVLGEGRRYALFDARSDRVYGACYDVEVDAIHEVVAPFSGTIEDVLGGVGLAGSLAVGDGAIVHRDVLEAAGAVVDEPPVSRSLAEGLLRYGISAPVLAPVGDVSLWEPSYLRAWAAGAA